MFRRTFISPVRFRQFGTTSSNKKMELYKATYIQSLHAIVPTTIIIYSFSFMGEHLIDRQDKSSLPEQMITGVTTGLMVGMTYPISFPLITAMTLYKNQQANNKK